MAELQANGVALSDQDKADARAGLGLGTAATADADDFATAAQGTDAREWSAATVLQAEAEAGTDATRRAWTVQRVWQAVAAWWASSAMKTKLDGIAAGATANATNAELRDRSTHTGTQLAATIGDSTVAGRAVLTGDAAAGRSALDLGTAATQSAAAFDAAGSAAAAQAAAIAASQPVDADLTAIAGLSTTSFGRSLLALADDAAARAAIGAAPVSGAGVSDATSLTLTTAHANTNRIPAGTQTYTVDGSTGWSVSDGIAVWLPASGTVSFAVSGGPTLNGGTSTLTRTLAGNGGGYVVLNRIAGTAAYSLSGA